MLTLRDVNAGYGSFQALFDISLDVNAGEAVAVIGPNGAGKTTLMRVISGLIPATKGQITMEGTDVLATKPHEIVSLGVAHVPEHRRLFPRMTVEDNLRMGCFAPAVPRPLRGARDFVYELFPRMKERRDQMAGTMSGGEQQMCAIGRALMSDPKILLMDEPSAGLAPVIVQQVFELIRRIRADGLTVSDRRAERQTGLGHCRPRVRAGGRHVAHERHGARIACKRRNTESLYGHVKVH